ncbi:hypothetical protein QMZ92_15835 [Streptomyces sp. HNM0645]|uniref:hypothetical protein n=1 Tax=Streptomyces sp. HNM0645 TaxID=2782343 RepID=UPI0024B843FE|nr:hypothetical protein [Streptomyces sp. HNM0645]MDI9885811.1 hypothetical protein [Streptomyces sp. HNM0645]
MLNTGITLSVHCEAFHPSDVMISSGTRRLADVPGIAADPTAVVPRDDWRHLTPPEREMLDPAPATPLNRMLTVLDLDADSLKACRDELLPMLAAARDGNADEQAAQRGAVLGRVRERVLDAVGRRVGARSTRQGASDSVVHRHGLVSTAYNYEQRTFMGLHLDNHEDFPLTERHRSLLLTVANLGFTDRYVHFVNLRTTDLMLMLAAAGHTVPKTGHALKNAFFAAFPAHPVLRVRLSPGQAYLVNTQDVLHDGATNTEGLPDVSFLTANRLTPAAPVREVR